MDKDECKGDITGHPLEPIAPVARESIVPEVRLSALSDPNTHDRVKEDRQEDKCPFNHGQKGDAVDRENRVLEDIRPAAEARVGQQMDTHVGTDGSQSA